MNLKTGRYTYKCTTCLGLFVVTGKLNHCIARCGICGDSEGAIFLMGEIGPDKHVRREDLKCNCNGACVNASGPNCDCRCGGENHQKGIEAYTVVVTDLGALTLTCTDAKTVTKHVKIAEEFRAAHHAAIERKLTTYPHKEFSVNAWISDKAHWWEARNSATLYSEAMSAKCHRTRMKKLAKCFLGVEKLAA